MADLSFVGTRPRLTQTVQMSFGVNVAVSGDDTPTPHSIVRWEFQNVPETRVPFTVLPVEDSTTIVLQEPNAVQNYQIASTWDIDAAETPLAGRTIASVNAGSNSLTLDQAVTIEEQLEIALVRPPSPADILRYVIDFSVNGALIGLQGRMESAQVVDLNIETDAYNYGATNWQLMRRSRPIELDVDAFLAAAGVPRSDQPIVLNP